MAIIPKPRPQGNPTLLPPELCLPLPRAVLMESEIRTTRSGDPAVFSYTVEPGSGVRIRGDGKRREKLIKAFLPYRHRLILDPIPGTQPSPITLISVEVVGASGDRWAGGDTVRIKTC